MHETERRELLGGTEENSVSPTRGLLICPVCGLLICPPGKSMSFHKKETGKIELVARPGNWKHFAIFATQDSTVLSYYLSATPVVVLGPP